MSFPVGFTTAFFLSSAPSTLTGLCSVPFLSSTTGAGGGAGAFKTLEGVLIISRIANASASATALLARIDFKSSSEVSFSTTTTGAGFGTTVFEASAFASTGITFLGLELLDCSCSFLLAANSASWACCNLSFFASFAACNSASCRASNWA